jgi:ribosomal protein L36
MFKSKKVVYILIPLNIAIWGYLLFRILNAYNGNNQIEFIEKSNPLTIKSISDSIEYKLNLNYEDPFLKFYANSLSITDVRNSTNVKMNVKTPANSNNLNKDITLNKPLNDIRYIGLVKNSNSGVATGLITFNGQSKLVRVNDKIEDLVFKSFDKKCLVIKRGRDLVIINSEKKSEY